MVVHIVKVQERLVGRVFNISRLATGSTSLSLLC